MTLAHVLRSAQNVLAECGWSEGLDSLAEVGPLSVRGAIAAAAKHARHASAAHELLETIVLPSVARYNELGDQLLGAGACVDPAEFRSAAAAAAACISIDAWLEQPSRTQVQVLRAFDLAILKAQSVEAA